MTQQLKIEQLERAVKTVLVPTTSVQDRLILWYQNWLTRQENRDAATHLHEMQDYAARAQQAVIVGKQRVQTFAPFRSKYSALQTTAQGQRVILCHCRL